MTPGLVPTNPVLTTFCFGLCIFYDKINCLLLKSIDWVSVYLFVSNKRQNGSTNQANIFCGTSHDPREGLWMLKGTKNGCSKVFDFCKISELFKNPWTFFVCFRLYKETMLFHLDLLNQAKNILLVLQNSSVKVWDKSVKRFLSSDRTSK